MTYKLISTYYRHICIFTLKRKFGLTIVSYILTTNQRKVQNGCYLKALSQNDEKSYQHILLHVCIFIPNIIKIFYGYLCGWESKSKKSTKLAVIKKLQVRMTKYLMCIYWWHMRVVQKVHGLTYRESLNHEMFLSQLDTMIIMINICIDFIICCLFFKARAL